MTRSYLVWLLLLNYLLVVGAGLVERPPRVIDRPFDYVHSHDCQLQHTLRLACFDDCNGVQYTLQKNGERPPLHHLIQSLKGVDLHCLPALPVVSIAPTTFGRVPAPYAAIVAGVPNGYQGQIDLPPRRG